MYLLEYLDTDHTLQAVTIPPQTEQILKIPNNSVLSREDAPLLITREKDAGQSPKTKENVDMPKVNHTNKELTIPPETDSYRNHLMTMWESVLQNLNEILTWN